MWIYQGCRTVVNDSVSLKENNLEILRVAYNCRTILHFFQKSLRGSRLIVTNCSEYISGVRFSGLWSSQRSTENCKKKVYEKWNKRKKIVAICLTILALLQMFSFEKNDRDGELGAWVSSLVYLWKIAFKSSIWSKPLGGGESFLHLSDRASLSNYSDISKKKYCYNRPTCSCCKRCTNFRVEKVVPNDVSVTG